MSRLLALSFDCSTSPTLRFGEATNKDKQAIDLYGWGISWYPNEGIASVIIKDAETKSREQLSKVFSESKHFNTTVMISNLRGASKHRAIQDTQPFTRSYAARDWVFTHNGDLVGKYKESLPTLEQPLFEPIGQTDSEYIFCWLLTQFNFEHRRKISDIDFYDLQKLFKKINELGTTNIMLSDGDDLIVYQDINSYNQLYCARKHPPHHQLTYESGSVSFEIDDENTAHRTFVLVTTDKDFSDTSTKLLPGQMLVIRRGKVIWDSEYGLNSSPESVTAFVSPASDTKKEELVADKSKVFIAKEQNLVKKHKQYLDVQLEQWRIFSLTHNTTYQYEKPVELSKHSFRLFPVQDRHQKILDYELSLSSSCTSETFDDVFTNRVNNVVIDTPYSELILSMQATIALRCQPTVSYSRLHKRQQIPLVWMPWQRQMMMPYLLPPELPETQLRELIDYAMSFVKRNDYDVFNILCDINTCIYADYSYISGSTSLETTPFDVYSKHHGVCQDFANLFICLARLLNIPARYRMGYIYTGGNYENKIQSDASHAWAEVYLPWLGWRGFDPTNGCIVDEDHIRIACGRAFLDATPTSGTIYKGGGKESLNVEVKVVLTEGENSK